MIETEMTELDRILERMGIDVSRDLINEAAEGITRADRELEESIKQIYELAQLVEEEGNPELAEELRSKAFEIKYPYWC